jgi:hypothetical protein
VGGYEATNGLSPWSPLVAVKNGVRLESNILSIKEVKKMPFYCPVEGCEKGEKEFQTEAALKSHIRNKHPDYISEEEHAREVPIVEDDFAALLKKFKIKADLSANIAENISHTGGPSVFEDAEILIKRLSL